MSVETSTYAARTNVDEMYRIHWGYEHSLSFYNLSWLKAVTNNKSTYQSYSGIDISLCGGHTVQICIEGTSA